MITTILEFKLNEIVETEYKFKCYLKYNKEKINTEELYSKIRAIKGITVVTSIELVTDDVQSNTNYYIGLNIKIDISSFNDFNIKWLKKEIKSIYGVNDTVIKYGEFEIKKRS